MQCNNLIKLTITTIRSGEEFYHAREIMACPGGCIGAGGQPKVIKNRGEGLNSTDRSKELRVSKDNPAVRAIYDKYLDHPLSHKAHELLHTRYFVIPKSDFNINKNNEM